MGETLTDAFLEPWKRSQNSIYETLKARTKLDTTACLKKKKMTGGLRSGARAHPCVINQQIKFAPTPEISSNRRNELTCEATRRIFERGLAMMESDMIQSLRSELTMTVLGIEFETMNTSFFLATFSHEIETEYCEKNKRLDGELPNVDAFHTAYCPQCEQRSVAMMFTPHMNVHRRTDPHTRTHGLRVSSQQC